MLEPAFCMFRCDGVNSLPKYVVHHPVLRPKLLVHLIVVCTQPPLDGRECELDWVEIG